MYTHTDLDNYPDETILAHAVLEMAIQLDTIRGHLEAMQSSYPLKVEIQGV